MLQCVSESSYTCRVFRHVDCGNTTKLSADMQSASTLLHEMIHGIFEPLAQTKYVHATTSIYLTLVSYTSWSIPTNESSYDFITFDLAYGFGACADLAQGTCNSSQPGIRCSPIATIANVDTIVWLIYGKFFQSLSLRHLENPTGQSR